MTTIRVAKRRRFTTVDRRTINDKRLTYKARGVLIWLLDKPDGWRCDSEAMAEASKDGKYAVRSALRELESMHYLRRSKHQNEQGHWVSEAEVYEVPTEPETTDMGESTEVRFSDVGESDDGELVAKSTMTDVSNTEAAAELVPESPPPTKEDIEAAKLALEAAHPWTPPIEPVATVHPLRPSGTDVEL